MNVRWKCLFGSAVLMVAVTLAPSNEARAEGFFDVFFEWMAEYDDGPTPQTVRQSVPFGDYLLEFFICGDKMKPDEGAEDDIMIYGAVTDPE